MDKQHAVINYDQDRDQHWVKDLGSLNGVSAGPAPPRRNSSPWWPRPRPSSPPGRAHARPLLCAGPAPAPFLPWTPYPNHDPTPLLRPFSVVQSLLRPQASALPYLPPARTSCSGGEEAPEGTEIPWPVQEPHWAGAALVAPVSQGGKGGTWTTCSLGSGASAKDRAVLGYPVLEGPLGSCGQ